MSSRALILIVGSSLALTVGLGGPAVADAGTPGAGGAQYVKNRLSAYTIYLSSDDAELAAGAGSLAGSGTPDPPTCWFQPAAFSITGVVNASWKAWTAGDQTQVDANVWRDYWVDQVAAHAGQDGMWYHIACRDYSAFDAFFAANPLFLWVPAAGPPPAVVGVVMTPEQLAQYARDSVILPKTVVELNPAARSTVNLDTWVWLDPTVFGPRHVHAQAGPLTVDAVASPHALLLPRSLPADLTPAGGECTDLHHAYTKGETPTCAITFGRSSAREPNLRFGAQFTLVWRVTWTSNWGVGGTLPDGRITGTVDIPVQEVQTIVTDAH
jgi:hypothetical protein